MAKSLPRKVKVDFRVAMASQPFKSSRTITCVLHALKIPNSRINSHVSRAHGDLLAKNSLRRYFGKKRERGTGLYLDKLMVFERKNVLLRYHGPVS